MQLFKSHREGIADGDQRRDFIYVDDVVRVMMWLLATPSVNGLLNVGTGEARSFRDLMTAAYASLGTKPNIEYVDMPETIRGAYQYLRKRISSACKALVTTEASRLWRKPSMPMSKAIWIATIAFANARVEEQAGFRNDYFAQPKTV